MALNAPGDEPRALGHRIASGASWLYGFRWIERLLDFGSTVVLARLLQVSDFGLVAIAISIVAIIEGLSAFDVSKALIRTREDTRGLFDTAWTLSTLRGVSAAVVMLVIASLISDPRMAGVLTVLAAAPVATGLGNPRFVLFERDLVFSKLASLTLGAKAVSVAVTVVLAIVHRSYWALVIGIVVGSVVSLVLSYALRPYRPRWTLARFSDLFSFSGWLSLTSVVTTLSMETDKLIVGRWLGLADTGRYFMTQRIGVLPTRELVSPLQRLLFPSFSELVTDQARLRRAVLESINVVGSLSLAAGCGFALVAGDFVPLILGEAWRDIVPLLVILVPYLGARATVSSTLPCVMALGQVRLLFWVSFAYALVHVPAFIAGTAFFGLKGAIGSLVLAGVLYMALNVWMLYRCLAITLGDIFRQLRRPLASTALMVLVLGGLRRLQPLGGFTSAASWLDLALVPIIGAVVYGVFLVMLWRLEGRPRGIERRILEWRR